VVPTRHPGRGGSPHTPSVRDDRKMKHMLKGSRILGLLAGVFFLIGSVVECNITWTQTALIASFGFLLVLPWTLIHNALLWWVLFLALAGFVIHFVVQALVTPSPHIHKQLIEACWVVVLVIQPLAIGALRRQSRIGSP